jgi:Ca-activated chloride channel family protein
VNTIAALHLLRPEWLIAIIPVTLIWWLVRSRATKPESGSTQFAAHLQAALTINRDHRHRLLPIDGVAIVLMACTLAATGPSFRQQASPWFSETAPLVIALEVTDSMRSNDLSPTRLERARFKILDLIQARTGASTGLIAYSGTAHIVMPPTRDIAVIKPFLESLDPAMMPKPGANLTAVLPLAIDVLGEDSGRSTLLLVTDGIDAADLPALRQFSARVDAPLLATLLVGTKSGGVALMPNGTIATNVDGSRVNTEVNLAQVKRIASESDMVLVRLQTDDTDLKTLLRRIESHLDQAADPDSVWLDDGWWFIWPAALLMLFWFRQGWTMKWS